MGNMKNKRGISLIVLVITIIVVIILAAAVILNMNENNPVTQAKEAKFKNSLSNFQNELELFVSKQEIQTQGAFEATTLNADEKKISYNTKPEEEKGDVYTILPSAKSSSFKGKIEIVKGNLVLTSKNEEELIWAKDMGVKINIFTIEEGVLKSSDMSLELINEEGILEIPSNVTKIDSGAFSTVPNLKKVIIPGNVEEIASDAFSNNASLESVIIEEGVKRIGLRAFKQCKNLKSVSIPDSVTSINIETFFGCYQLSDVRLPANLNELSNHMFYGCSSLNNIELPKNIKAIGTSALNGTAIEKIIIPNTVTQIGSRAFSRNKNLKEFSIEDGNPIYTFENGVLYSNNKTKIDAIIENKQTDGKFVIPNGIIELVGGIFESGFNIEEIEVPASVQKIDNTTFDELEKTLKKVTIDPNNLYYSSDENAFYDKKKENLIRYISKDSVINIKDGVVSLGRQCFKFCNNTTNITLPDSLKIIGSEVFTMKSLKQLYLGKNIEKIEPLGFYGAGITDLVISSDNPYYTVEDGYVYNKDKTVLITYVGQKDIVKIPKGVKEIGNLAFHNKSLKQIEIPNSVTRINAAFNYCNQLKDMIIPESVEYIAAGTFSNSYGIQKVIIKKPRNSIAGSPFGLPVGERGIEWSK